jgi:hypothetical protein
LVEKIETVQVRFTLEGDGLRVQRNYHGWNNYMDSYMVDYENVSQTCLEFVSSLSSRGMLDTNFK